MNWAPKKKKLTMLDAVNDFLFAVAFVAAFAAGVRQIEVAKKAEQDGTPQSPDVVGLILAVKACKLPKTLVSYHRQPNFYNGFLLAGVVAAIGIWSVALAYTMH